MFVSKIVQFAVFAIAVLWESKTDAATRASIKFCGRQLSEIMSRVCHAYNSPSWDVPTGLMLIAGTGFYNVTGQRVRALRALSQQFMVVVATQGHPFIEQPGSAVRRKRQLGIADECCIIGCNWEQLSEYCSIKAYSESPLEDLAAHIIADRSAEQEAAAQEAVNSTTKKTTSVVSEAGKAGGRREVGRARNRGYGRARGRCWCRRRRSGRRRPFLMGNTVAAKNAVRAAPVVGTVSPLITWGRTLNTNLPLADRDRYAYVVYS